MSLQIISFAHILRCCFINLSHDRCRITCTCEIFDECYTGSNSFTEVYYIYSHALMSSGFLLLTITTVMTSYTQWRPLVNGLVELTRYALCLLVVIVQVEAGTSYDVEFFLSL